MNPINLYPLLFEPVYEYRPWGGRRLADMLSTPLPGEGPIGEAWLLSDRDDYQSIIANGPLKGQTIAQILKQSPGQLMGKSARRFRRFPLLLKFLDARKRFSVQVHPSDQQKNFLPAGETGKSEAWVVLMTGTKSLIYAGLKPDTTEEVLRRAIDGHTLTEHLASFRPKPGDAVFLPAGTVHSMGDLTVFEVQENSDVTFRLYDWDHIDAKTGQLRPLQVDKAMACIDLSQGAVGPVVPVVEEGIPVLRERLFDSEHFGLWRYRGDSPFKVGFEGKPRVLVCIEGEGQLEYDSVDYAVGKGDVLLLPAVAGECLYRPRGVVSLLEISLPEAN